MNRFAITAFLLAFALIASAANADDVFPPQQQVFSSKADYNHALKVLSRLADSSGDYTPEQAAADLRGRSADMLPFILHLFNEKPDAVSRGNIMRILAGYGTKPAREALMRILKKGSPGERVNALDLVKDEMSEEEMADCLVPMLLDSERDTRRFAAKMIFRLRERFKKKPVALRVANVLSGSAKAGRGARRDVIRLLGWLKDPRTLAYLRNPLMSYNLGLKRAAMRAAAQMGTSEARESLEEILLNDYKWQARMLAACLLKKFLPEALPALAEALKDEKDLVRKCALRTLENTTGKKLGGNPEAWKRWIVSDGNKMVFTNGELKLKSIYTGEEIQEMFEEIYVDDGFVEGGVETEMREPEKPETSASSVTLTIFVILLAFTAAGFAAVKFLGRPADGSEERKTPVKSTKRIKKDVKPPRPKIKEIREFPDI